MLPLGSVFAVQTAHADDAFQGGDCWVSGTPLQCAAGYASGNLYYYNVQQGWAPSSTIQTNASSGLSSAQSNWTSASGPQVIRAYGQSDTPNMNVYVWEFSYYTSGDSIYDNGMYNPTHNGAGVAYAVTRNWYWTGSAYAACYSYACSVAFSEVYLSQPWAATCSGGRSTTVWTYTLAHELGHAQGLADHSSSNILMNNSWSNSCTPSSSATSPTSTDIGSIVSSGATSCSSPKGIRCIFKWDH